MKMEGFFIGICASWFPFGTRVPAREQKDELNVVNYMIINKIYLGTIWVSIYSRIFSKVNIRKTMTTEKLKGAINF